MATNDSFNKSSRATDPDKTAFSVSVSTNKNTDLDFILAEEFQKSYSNNDWYLKMNYIDREKLVEKYIVLRKANRQFTPDVYDFGCIVNLTSDIKTGETSELNKTIQDRYRTKFQNMFIKGSLAWQYEFLHENRSLTTADFETLGYFPNIILNKGVFTIDKKLDQKVFYDTKQLLEVMDEQLQKAALNEKQNADKHYKYLHELLEIHKSFIYTKMDMKLKLKKANVIFRHACELFKINVLDDDFYTKLQVMNTVYRSPLNNFKSNYDDYPTISIEFLKGTIQILSKQDIKYSNEIIESYLSSVLDLTKRYTKAEYIDTTDINGLWDNQIDLLNKLHNARSIIKNLIDSYPRVGTKLPLEKLYSLGLPAIENKYRKEDLKKYQPEPINRRFQDLKVSINQLNFDRTKIREYKYKDLHPHNFNFQILNYEKLKIVFREQRFHKTIRMALNKWKKFVILDKLLSIKCKNMIREFLLKWKLGDLYIPTKGGKMEDYEEEEKEEEEEEQDDKNEQEKKNRDDTLSCNIRRKQDTSESCDRKSDDGEEIDTSSKVNVKNVRSDTLDINVRRKNGDSEESADKKISKNNDQKFFRNDTMTLYYKICVLHLAIRGVKEYKVQAMYYCSKTSVVVDGKVLNKNLYDINKTSDFKYFLIFYLKQLYVLNSEYLSVKKKYEPEYPKLTRCLCFMFDKYVSMSVFFNFIEGKITYKADDDLYNKLSMGFMAYLENSKNIDFITMKDISIYIKKARQTNLLYIDNGLETWNRLTDYYDKNSSKLAEEFRKKQGDKKRKTTVEKYYKGRKRLQDIDEEAELNKEVKETKSVNKYDKPKVKVSEDIIICKNCKQPVISGEFVDGEAYCFRCNEDKKEQNVEEKGSLKHDNLQTSEQKNDVITTSEKSDNNVNVNNETRKESKKYNKSRRNKRENIKEKKIDARIEKIEFENKPKTGEKGPRPHRMLFKSYKGYRENFDNPRGLDKEQAILRRLNIDGITNDELSFAKTQIKMSEEDKGPKSELVKVYFMQDKDNKYHEFLIAPGWNNTNYLKSEIMKYFLGNTQQWYNYKVIDYTTRKMYFGGTQCWIKEGMIFKLTLVGLKGGMKDDTAEQQNQINEKKDEQPIIEKTEGNNFLTEPYSYQALVTRNISRTKPFADTLYEMKDITADQNDIKISDKIVSYFQFYDERLIRSSEAKMMYLANTKFDSYSGYMMWWPNIVNFYLASFDQDRPDVNALYDIDHYAKEGQTEAPGDLAAWSMAWRTLTEPAHIANLIQGRNDYKRYNGGHWDLDRWDPWDNQMYQYVDAPVFPIKERTPAINSNYYGPCQSYDMLKKDMNRGTNFADLWQKMNRFNYASVSNQYASEVLQDAMSLSFIQTAAGSHEAQFLRIILYLFMKITCRSCIYEHNSNAVWQYLDDSFHMVYERVVTPAPDDPIDTLHISWCTWKQYSKCKLHNIEDDTIDQNFNNEPFVFVPTTRQMLLDIDLMNWDILSRSSYPLFNAWFSITAVNQNAIGPQATFSVSTHHCNLLASNVYIRGLTKICYVIVDMDNLSDDPQQPNYPVYLDCAGREIGNLFNGFTQGQFAPTDMQVPLLNWYRVKSGDELLQSLKKYLHYKHFEIPLSTFKTATYLTSIFKATYNSPTEYSDPSLYPTLLNGINYIKRSMINSPFFEVEQSDFWQELYEIIGIIHINAYDYVKITSDRDWANLYKSYAYALNYNLNEVSDKYALPLMGIYGATSEYSNMVDKTYEKYYRDIIIFKCPSYYIKDIIRPQRFHLWNINFNRWYTTLYGTARDWITHLEGYNISNLEKTAMFDIDELKNNGTEAIKQRTNNADIIIFSSNKGLKTKRYMNVSVSNYIKNFFRREDYPGLIQIAINVVHNGVFPFYRTVRFTPFCWFPRTEEKTKVSLLDCNWSFHPMNVYLYMQNSELRVHGYFVLQQNIVMHLPYLNFYKHATHLMLNNAPEDNLEEYDD